ncbi:hypothetical protein GIB67_009889 [Kingdonia uniflora]|uniref:Uncharacterized protein n=1 Tax=Kingdonia uniflora TaxID=39325 RepID=A0A7J7L7R5_9MAGN|nr:hypothetical protein GIB67_009889 [Kingdonia uniflora]
MESSCSPCKEYMFSPPVASQFGCKNQPPKIEVMYYPRFNLEGKFPLKNCENWKSNAAVNPNPSDIFLKAPEAFMIIYDLSVAPFSFITSISLLEKQKVAIEDMEVWEVSIGQKELSTVARSKKSGVNLIVKEKRFLSTECDLGKRSSSSDKKLSERRWDRSFLKRHPGKEDDCCLASTGWFSMRSKSSIPASKFVVLSDSEKTSSSRRGDECSIMEETVNSVGTIIEVVGPSRSGAQKRRRAKMGKRESLSYIQWGWM